MNKDFLIRLAHLGATFLIALLVWRYYRSKTSLRGQYSTFWPRFWTGSVDVCVLWPIGFVTLPFLSPDVPKGVSVMPNIVESLAWIVYTVVMHARYGQTVGKMVTKVRVVDFRTEGKISWLQACLRAVIPGFCILVSLGIEISLRSYCETPKPG